MSQPIEEIAPMVAGALAGAAAEELGVGLAGRLIATTLAKTAAAQRAGRSHAFKEFKRKKLCSGP